MNFFHFDGAEMTLRHVTLRGITGWPRLFDTLNDIWTPDVKANQLADVLSGVAPIRSLVNVGAGMADLVLLPIEQYQKDGRIVRGVQKGATSFAKTTALEVAKLGARLATGTHVILEQAEHVLGGRMKGTMLGEAVSGDARSSNALPGFAAEGSEDGNEAMEEEIREAVSRYADQPEDLREALAQAYQGLSKGFNSAAQTILAVPMEIYERGGGEVSMPFPSEADFQIDLARFPDISLSILHFPFFTGRSPTRRARRSDRNAPRRDGRERGSEQDTPRSAQLARPGRT